MAKSRMFVNPNGRVRIWEWEPDERTYDQDGQLLQPNWMEIREKMDLDTRGKVTGSMIKVGADAAGQTQVDFDLAANQKATLLYNILAWGGPDLEDDDGRPLSINEQTVGQLDPDQPLVGKVMDEIARRNPVRKSPSPKSPTTNGSMSAIAPATLAGSAEVIAEILT